MYTNRINMTKEELTKQIKELAVHFGERISCEWLSTDGQEWVEWKNVEITVPFLINLEKGYIRNIRIQRTSVTIQSELIASFRSFQEWVDQVSAGADTSEDDQTVCVDRSNKILVTEEDFVFAEDNNLFPVYVYRMLRNTEK